MKQNTLKRNLKINMYFQIINLNVINPLISVFTRQGLENPVWIASNNVHFDRTCYGDLPTHTNIN